MPRSTNEYTNPQTHSNFIIVVIPGAMDAGLGSLLFWGSLAFALAVAIVAAFPVNTGT
jgi:Domain of unknown function (DUF4396)